MIDTFTTSVSTISAKFEALAPFMDERVSRYWAATEAKALGRGGIGVVAQVTGISRTTIAAGIRELATGGADSGSASQLWPGRIRRSGAGRKSILVTEPGVVEALETLVEPDARGDPMSPLKWTCKSLRNLSDELKLAGYVASPPTVSDLLAEAGYGLQGTRKTLEGKGHPDRDAQFRHINRCVKAFQHSGEPVVSIDTKKKELIGPFKNAGREWHRQKTPPEVRVHDFIDKQMGKAIPYGVYDLSRNEGWVSVGTDHDTPAFAAETVARWWREMGRQVYPNAKRLMITADGGGSNGYRARAWKVGLQKVADETGLALTVCHFPPGTSKWNKIEHRMFCHITRNWRGKPLESTQAVVSLIGATTTRKGLRIRASLDENLYPTGIKISAKELAEVKLREAGFHGEWNYRVTPAKPTVEPVGENGKRIN